MINMYLCLQVEETVQKDSFVEDVVEKKLPQVKAMYPYKGQGLEVNKGEVRSSCFSLVFSMHAWFI